MTASPLGGVESKQKRIITRLLKILQSVCLRFLPSSSLFFLPRLIVLKANKLAEGVYDI